MRLVNFYFKTYKLCKIFLVFLIFIILVIILVIYGDKFLIDLFNYIDLTKKLSYLKTKVKILLINFFITNFAVLYNI